MNLAKNLSNTFKAYFSKNIIIILLLGFSCGLPLPLVLSTIKAMLFEKGFNLKVIGFISLVSLPYSIKFLWAPFIDSLPIPYLSRKLGKYRSWILIAQILLMIAIAALGFYGNRGDLFFVAIFAIITAFISATQDIAVDAYRIENIKKEDQAIAAAMYIYGYRIAMLISGAFALILSDHISWDKVHYTMSAFVVIGVITTLLASEKSPKFLKSANSFEWINNSVIKPLSDFTKHNFWLVMLLFVICFKLPDAIAGSLTLPFLLDIDFSKTEIGVVVKGLGLFATLTGVFLGGILVKTLGIARSLWIAIIAQSLSNLAFYYLSINGHSITALSIVIFIENFSGGIGDAIFVAYLSSLCNINFPATQYAILISFGTMGRSILSSYSGVIASYLGWSNFFLFSAAAALPAVLCLLLLNRKKLR